MGMSYTPQRLRLGIIWHAAKWSRCTDNCLAVLICLLAIGACEAPTAEFATVTGSSEAGPTDFFELRDGTPEASAVLRALNDPAVTVDRLISEVGVSHDAAQSWIAYRDHQSFRELAEVLFADGVTERDVELLAQWAWSSGYLPYGESTLGTWDDVEFTVEAAQRTLYLANKAEKVVLDEIVGLDRRAVESILSARPVSTIAELSTLFWIGPEAMQLLKAFALEMNFL